MKLELGCGNRPTGGYLHQDVTELTTLDFHCQPWEVDLPEESLDEVLALGVMEHLRKNEFYLTVNKVYKLLRPEGIFLFDVPDILVWSEYLYKVLRGEKVPFSREHIFSTFWGWQRWQGDEHKWGWTREEIIKALNIFLVKDGFEDMIKRVFRNRFARPEDAHIYIKAIK